MQQFYSSFDISRFGITRFVVKVTVASAHVARPLAPLPVRAAPPAQVPDADMDLVPALGLGRSRRGRSRGRGRSSCGVVLHVLAADAGLVAKGGNMEAVLHEDPPVVVRVIAKHEAAGKAVRAGEEGDLLLASPLAPSGTKLQLTESFFNDHVTYAIKLITVLALSSKALAKGCLAPTLLLAPMRKASCLVSILCGGLRGNIGRKK